MKNTLEEDFELVAIQLGSELSESRKKLSKEERREALKMGGLSEDQKEYVRLFYATDALAEVRHHLFS